MPEVWKIVNIGIGLEERKPRRNQTALRGLGNFKYRRVRQAIDGENVQTKIPGDITLLGARSVW